MEFNLGDGFIREGSISSRVNSPSFNSGMHFLSSESGFVCCSHVKHVPSIRMICREMSQLSGKQIFPDLSALL